MQPLLNWIGQHQALATFIATYIFSVAVSGLPVPTTASSVWYVWLYTTLHSIAANWSNIMASKKLPPPAAAEPITPAVAEPVPVKPEEGKE